jgi:cytoskeletal protein CcmA (bactofilin family)
MMLGKKEMDDFDKSGDLNTIIGKGSVIEGNLKVQNSMRVDGRIKGQITASDAVVVGKEGEIEGELRVKNIIIGGRIKGKIFASGKVVLEARAVFQGELKTSKLVIDDGAVFDGTCSMTEGGKILALPEAADGRQPFNVERTPQREALASR